MLSGVSVSATPGLVLLQNVGGVHVRLKRCLSPLVPNLLLNVVLPPIALQLDRCAPIPYLYTMRASLRHPPLQLTCHSRAVPTQQPPTSHESLMEGVGADGGSKCVNKYLNELRGDAHCQVPRSTPFPIPRTADPRTC